MYSAIVASVLIAVSAPALAQMSPVGLWRSIDDKTEQPKAEIRISADANGVLSGVVDKALSPSAEPNCELCTDDRKGKPKLGMESSEAPKRPMARRCGRAAKFWTPKTARNTTYV